MELGQFVYVYLKMTWLKFLCIWRFMRVWSLLDGVETVENMKRCMSNNWTLSGFWRAWHSSFNRWLIRYIYIPIGGNKKYKIVSIFAVFTFVAIWHDRTMKLLVWGWFSALTFIPELLITKIAKLKYFKHLNDRSNIYYRFLVSIFGGINIMLLMAANLLGYGVGIKGTALIANNIFVYNTNAIKAILYMYILFYCLVQIMLEVRNEEYRKTGKFKKH